MIVEDEQEIALTDQRFAYLPEDWGLITIGEVFAIQQGKQVSSEKRAGDNVRPFLRTANVFWGRLKLTVLDQMHFSQEECQRLALQPNDLLVCEGGDVGRTALWNGEQKEIYFQNHLHRLRLRSATTADATYFMFWMMYAVQYTDLYTGEANRTTIPNLSKSRLSSFVYPLPPLPEQRAIARVLSTVQAAIAKQDEIIQTTQALKNALMHKLFTGGLSGEPTKNTEVGPVPESWDVVRVGDVFIIQQGKQVSARNRDGDNVCPFLRTANVFWGKLDLELLDQMHFSKEETQRLKLQLGDLLVCEGGDIGRTAYWNNDKDGIYYQNHLHRLRAKSDQQTDPRFFMYWLMYALQYTSLYSGEANRTTIPNLSKSRLSGFLYPFPVLEKQQEITRILLSVDGKINYHHTRKQTLESLFRTLLHELMTGQRRVTTTHDEAH